MKAPGQKVNRNANSRMRGFRAEVISPYVTGANAGIDVAEAGVIEDVEELSTELKPGEFSNGEGLVESPVPNVLWPAHV